MKIDLWRKYRMATYTIGLLSIDGEFLCNTLEDRDRGLTSTMSEADIYKQKIKGQTAIPTGEYRVIMTKSPKLGKVTPRLCDVKGYQGILIHSGNTAVDTEGCILPGMNTKKGMVTESRKYTNIIYARISSAIEKQERVTINIHW